MRHERRARLEHRGACFGHHGQMEKAPLVRVLNSHISFPWICFFVNWNLVYETVVCLESLLNGQKTRGRKEENSLNKILMKNSDIQKKSVRKRCVKSSSIHTKSWMIELAL